MGTASPSIRMAGDYPSILFPQKLMLSFAQDCDLLPQGN